MLDIFISVLQFADYIFPAFDQVRSLTGYLRDQKCRVGRAGDSRHRIAFYIITTPTIRLGFPIPHAY